MLSKSGMNRVMFMRPSLLWEHWMILQTIHWFWHVHTRPVLRENFISAETFRSHVNPPTRTVLSELDTVVTCQKMANFEMKHNVNQRARVHRKTEFKMSEYLSY